MTRAIRSFVAAGLSVGLGVTLAAADDPPAAPPPAENASVEQADASPPAETPRHADGRRTLSRLVPNLGRGAIGVFSKPSLFPFAMGMAATSVGSLFDQDFAEEIAKPGDGGSKALATSFGGVSAVAVTAVFVAGRFANGDRFRAASYDMLDAVAVNGGYTFGLKAAVGRERPNKADKHSFPSGHTSNAFALAAVLDGHYSKKVAIPAYFVASLVGLSRMRLNAHWLSDVVAGATLGQLVGMAVVRVNDKPLSKEPQRTQVTVAPLVGSINGLWVAVSF